MKNEVPFPLITEQPSSFAPGTAIFCFLPHVCLLRINSTYSVLVHWLEIVKCKGSFCVRNVPCECPGENTLQYLLFDLVWPAGFHICYLAHHVSSLLAAKCIDTILIPLFLPPFPHRMQEKPQHYLPVEGRCRVLSWNPTHGFYWGGFLSMVRYILEQKVPKVDAEASHDGQTYLPDTKCLQQVGSSSSA